MLNSADSSGRVQDRGRYTRAIFHSLGTALCYAVPVGAAVTYTDGIRDGLAFAGATLALFFAVSFRYAKHRAKPVSVCYFDPECQSEADCIAKCHREPVNKSKAEHIADTVAYSVGLGFSQAERDAINESIAKLDPEFRAIELAIAKSETNSISFVDALTLPQAVGKPERKSKTKPVTKPRPVAKRTAKRIAKPKRRT